MREGRNRPTRTGNPARAVQHRRVQPLRHAARIARVSGGTGRGYRKQHRRWTRSDFCRRDQPAGAGGGACDRRREGEEAKDIGARKGKKAPEPMKASTNATSVLWGTAWTTNTLLYQAKQAALRQQAKDGVRRYFAYPADVVAQYVPAYAAHVADRRERLGARHPLIVTQYDLKEIDHEGGLFPDARQALMRGTHERRRAPEPGKQYALLVDVAGEDEEQRGSAEVLERDQLANKKRDATAITVVEMGPGDQWSYLVRDRSLFLGVPHTALYERINALGAHWSARWLLVDATGVGGGRGCVPGGERGGGGCPVRVRVGEQVGSGVGLRRGNRDGPVQGPRGRSV